MRVQSSLAYAVALFLIALVPSVAQAEEGHSHEKKEAGPNGGRLITSVEPHVEFLVTEDKKVQICFVDEAGKVVAPAEQVVEVTTGERRSPVKLTFEKKDSVLLSEQPLPEGERLPTVVQIRETPDSKAVVERFNLDLAHCPGCNLKEYACTCEH